MTSSVHVVTSLALLEAHGYPARITRVDERTLPAPDEAARVNAEEQRLPRALPRAVATTPAFPTEEARHDAHDAPDALEYPRRRREADVG